MFTGIVTHRARVRAAASLASGGGGVRLSVAPEGSEPLAARVGDSVAVDGVCLTVAAFEDDGLAFDVVPETLRRTTLGALAPGRRVNLEAALRLGDALGGHLVQGHVDGVGRVEAVERRGDDVRVTISLPEALHGSTIEKGSVTVDGVSLTVGESEESRFAVYLVPHTLAVTGLADKSPGDGVNVEADVIGRYVEHHLRRLGRSAPASERPSESGGPPR